MTTQLQVHTDEIPTFEFCDHGYFQVVRMVVKGDKGGTTQITVFLPKGSTKGDIMKSVAEMTVEYQEPAMKSVAKVTVEPNEVPALS